MALVRGWLGRARLFARALALAIPVGGVAVAGAACQPAMKLDIGPALSDAVAGAIEDTLFPPNGKDGRISFYFRTAPACERGCGIAPLLVGTEELLVVSSRSGPLAADIRAESSNPAIVAIDVVPDPGGADPDAGPVTPVAIRVRAVAVGQAEIRVLDAKGTLIDRKDLEVGDAARLRMIHSAPGAGASVVSSISVGAKHSYVASYLPVDDEGTNLQASSGVTFTTGNERVAIVQLCDVACRAEDERVNSASMIPKFVVTGVASGKTTLTAKAGSFSVTVPVAVTQ